MTCAQLPQLCHQHLSRKTCSSCFSCLNVLHFRDTRYRFFQRTHDYTDYTETVAVQANMSKPKYDSCACPWLLNPRSTSRLPQRSA